MKQLFISALLLVALFYAKAECRNDTVFSYSYITGTSIKELKQKVVYTYDAEGNLVLYLVQDWQSASSTWINNTKNTYTFLNDSLTSETLSQTWNTTTNTWVNSSRYNYTYNANGKLTEQVYQTWNTTTSAWVASTKYTFTYNASNQRIQDVSQLWNTTTNTWENTGRSIVAYNTNGNQVEFINQSWNTTTLAWLNSFKTSFAYDANNNQIENVYQGWNEPTGWENSSRGTSTYNANNVQIGSLGYQWDAGNWVVTSRSTSTFNAANLLTEYLYESYDNILMSLQNSTKTVTSYTANNDIESETTQLWQTASTNWVNYYLRSRTYNSSRKLTTYLEQNWDVASNSWVNDQGSTRGYNANNDLISWEFYSDWNVVGNYYNTRQYQEYRCTQINVGIEELATTSTFSIYPNPITSNTTTINSMVKTDYTLFDITGKTIQTGNLNIGENRIQLNQAAAGIYIFKVGNQTQKISIQ